MLNKNVILREEQEQICPRNHLSRLVIGRVFFLPLTVGFERKRQKHKKSSECSPTSFERKSVSRSASFMDASTRKIFPRIGRGGRLGTPSWCTSSAIENTWITLPSSTSKCCASSPTITSRKCGCESTRATSSPVCHDPSAATARREFRSSVDL